MSKRDQAEVFSSARDQGFQTRVASGPNHMEVWCHGTGGRCTLGCDPERGFMVTKASVTPSDIRGTERLKQHLMDHGWMRPGDWKQFVKAQRAEAKRQRRDERLAAADQQPEQEQEETTNEDGEGVAKIGDVARVTRGDGKAVDPQELNLMPASEIIANVELAAELLWEKVMEKVREDGPEPMTHGTVKGYRWEGSRDGAIRELWPSIPRGGSDLNIDPRKMALATYMKRTNNMVCLEPGNRFKASIWWVRANFSKVISKEHSTLTERRLTAQEAGEDRDPAPVTITRKEPHLLCPECDAPFDEDAAYDEHRLKEHGVCPDCGKESVDYRVARIHQSRVHGKRSEDYERNRAVRDVNAGLVPVQPDKNGYLRCPDCRLVTKSPNIFGDHRRALIGQPHPDPIFACRLCKERLDNPDRLSYHYTTTHDSSVVICRRCGDVYPDRHQLYDHKVKAHRMRRTRADGELYPGDAGYEDAGDVPAREPEEMPRLTATVTAPSPFAGDPDADAISYFESLIKYQREQRETIDGLNRHLEELERENSELRREVERLEKDGGTAERQRLVAQLTKITKERDDLHLKLETLRSAFKGLG